RRCPHLSSLQRQLHEPADRGVTGVENAVSKLRCRGIARVPSQNASIKTPRRRHVGRQQLVPSEVCVAHHSSPFADATSSHYSRRYRREMNADSLKLTTMSFIKLNGN